MKTLARPFTRLAALWLAVPALLLAAGCGAQGSPTATVISTDTPTALAVMTPVPTGTSAPVVTATAPLPTDTAVAATPTEEAAASPTGASTPQANATPPSYNWQQVGLTGKVVQSLALLPVGNNFVIAAGPQGAWSSTYEYKDWKPLDVKMGGRQAVASIGSLDVAYISSHTGCASGLPTSLQRTTDGGKSWQQVTGDNAPLVVSASNGGVAYGATCTGIAKTTDSGATWKLLEASKIQNHDPYAVAASPDGDTVFAAYASEGGSGRVNRSTDGGATWKEVTPPAPADETFQAPSNMVFMPGSVGRPDDGGLYMTTDAGLWFLPIGSDDWKAPKADPRMDNPAAAGNSHITALFVDTAYSEEYNKPGPVIYIARAQTVNGTQQGEGAFRSTNGGLTWDPMGTGTGSHAINSLVLAPHDPSATPRITETLLAATDDGVWAIPMPPPFR